MILLAHYQCALAEHHSRRRRNVLNVYFAINWKVVVLLQLFIKRVENQNHVEVPEFLINLTLFAMVNFTYTRLALSLCNL